MKGNLTVDYKWAYQHVVESHNFEGKSPEWVNAFVLGWMEGYVEGFLEGWSNAKIETACNMLGDGITCERVSVLTNISLESVKKIVKLSKE